MFGARHFSLAALTATAAAVLLPTASWAAFQSIGASLNVDGTSSAAGARIADIAGTPYITWVEPAITSQLQVFVARLQGSSWRRVGGSLNGAVTDSAQFPSLADVGGVPYVTWQESNFAGDEVEVSKWTKGGWLRIAGTNAAGGAIGSGDDKTLTPSIAAIPASCAGCSGTVPAVAFEDIANDGTGRIYVKTWNGAKWQQLGSGPANAASPSDLVDEIRTAVVRGPSGANLYVAWRDITTNTVHVATLNSAAGAWSEIGGPLNGEPGSLLDDPSISGVGGVPDVAWDELDSTGYRVHVAQFIAGSWRSVGAPVSIGAGAALGPSITGVSGVPFLAWAQPAAAGGPDQARVAAFGGGRWREVGRPLNASASHSAFAPQITTVARVPYVAWEESAASGSGSTVAPNEARAARYSPPSCSGARLKVRHDAAKVVSLSCSDGPADVIRVLAKPRHGRLTAVKGRALKLLYTPARGFAGKDTFAYTGNDGAADAPAATVTLSVAQGRPPKLTGLSITRNASAAGWVIAFTLDRPGRVLFAVQVLRAGKWVTVGRTFSKLASARPTKLRFRGRGLARGRYRLVAWAMLAEPRAMLSAPSVAGFRVLR